MYWKSSLLLEIEAGMLLTLRTGRLFQWEAQLLVAFFGFDWKGKDTADILYIHLWFGRVSVILQELVISLTR